MIEIIMPVYNAGDPLLRAIESVIAQTRKDWQLWIIDDGSTDITTKAIIGRYEQKENSKIQIRHKKNGGPSDARNFALSHIELDSIVAYCDADDYWEPYHLLEKMSWIDGGYDFVYCNPHLIDEDFNQMYPNFSLYDNFDHDRLKKGNFIFTPTVIHKNGLGFFDCNLDGLEDYDYWIRAVKAKYSIYQSDIKTCTCTVRTKGDNMSSKGLAALPKIKEKHKDFLI